MPSCKAVEGPGASIFREFASTKIHGVTAHDTIVVTSLFISVRISNFLHKQDSLLLEVYRRSQYSVRQDEYELEEIWKEPVMS
jgi:hypothetical protein